MKACCLVNAAADKDFWISWLVFDGPRCLAAVLLLLLSIFITCVNDSTQTACGMLIAAATSGSRSVRTSTGWRAAGNNLRSFVSQPHLQSFYRSPAVQPELSEWVSDTLSYKVQEQTPSGNDRDAVLPITSQCYLLLLSKNRVHVSINVLVHYWFNNSYWSRPIITAPLSTTLLLQKYLPWSRNETVYSKLWEL